MYINFIKFLLYQTFDSDILDVNTKLENHNAKV